jgi:hypothetical protein
MFDPHPLAKVLPAMSGEDYGQLRDDIAANGLLDPITLYEGKVLDGIHRQKVCAETKVDPRYEQFEGDDPVRFVFSKNIARRHLTVGQRAMLGTEIQSRYGHGGNRKGSKDQVRNSALDLTRDDVAAIVGVDRSTVTAAARVKKERPDLARKVKAGKTSLNAAYEATTGRHTGGNGPRRTKAWNGKTNPTRERELRAGRKNGTGNYNDLLRLSLDMNRACSIIEAYHVDDFDLEATTLDLVDTFHDDLITLAEWVDRALLRTQAWLGDVKVRRKIDALRNTTGRTPEETENFHRVADKLEAKLAALLPSGV